MSDFVNTSEAFLAARARASVAAALEADLLHQVINEAKVVGLSTREVSAAIGVPKSTVARHWQVGHECPRVLPAWGSESEWRNAHSAVWSHDPEKQADNWVPYEWFGEDGQPAVRSRARPTSTRSLHNISHWPPEPLIECAGGVCGRCERCRAKMAQNQ